MVPTSGCRSSITKLVSFPGGLQLFDSSIRRHLLPKQFFVVRSLTDRSQESGAFPLAEGSLERFENLGCVFLAGFYVVLHPSPSEECDLTLVKLSYLSLKINVFRDIRLSKTCHDPANQRIRQPFVVQLLENQRDVFPSHAQATH